MDLPVDGGFDKLMNQLRTLSASDVDVENRISDFLDELAQIITCDRIFFADIRDKREVHLYGSEGAVSDEAAMETICRLRGLTEGAIAGQYLLNKLNEAEQASLHLREPLLVAAGKGAILCDRDIAQPWMQTESELVGVVASLLENVLKAAALTRELQIQDRILTRVLENLDANALVTDLETDEILYANQRMRGQAHARTNQDIIGQICWKALHDRTERCETCPTPYLKKNPNTQRVWEEHNPDTGRYYRKTESVVEWINGRPAHMQLSVNVTAEKRAKQGLAALGRTAEIANQAKTDFLSRMSHEIRTPITAIIGMTRIAKNADSLEKARQCLDKIDGSSNQLLDIINDVLDMSKINANKMDILVEEFDFEKMLIEISNVISVRASEKNQKLYIRMDTEMPRYYLGDSHRFSQVIMNLLSNAVKFTPENGRIRVDIHEKSRTGDRSTVEVSVSDSGIGIPPEYQERLFTSFEQADGGIARKFGGTGLGLAICKSIVEMMGGEISVSSEVGKGSIFTFTAVLQALADKHERQEKLLRNVDINKLRVLLIDEDAEIRDYFAEIMREQRIQAETAVDCAAGIACIERAEAAGSPFGVVFLDWKSPGINEPQTMRRIRLHGSVAVFLNSVGNWAEAYDEDHAVGTVRFIPKPLFPSVLIDVINEVIGLPQRCESFAAGSRQSFAGYTILLAEDVEINREILIQDFSDTKVQIDTAQNGRIALEMFEQNPARYDLILMDIHMPEMDGYEATRRIRALEGVPRARNIPIVAMTANVFAQDIQKCLESGMNDHLAKPIEVDKLFSKVAYYLTQFEMPVVDTEEMIEQEETGVTEIADLELYVNVEEGLARIKGNKAIYKTLLKSFQKNTYWDQICGELDSGDLEAAARTAHTIKGMAGNLSLPAVYETVVLLEAQIKSGFDYAETFARLQEAVLKTMACIEAVTATL